MTLKELGKIDNGAVYIKTRELIKKTLEDMSLLPAEHLYKDGVFSTKDTVEQIRSMCFFNEKDTSDFTDLFGYLFDFGARLETIGDEEAQQAIARGDFAFDEDDDEYGGPSAADEYKAYCESSYLEGMRILSDMCRGWCVDTLNKEGR